ncbi:MAG: hypothetical protein OHK0026_16460 [Rhodocyclaceae bacterium]
MNKSLAAVTAGLAIASASVPAFAYVAEMQQFFITRSGMPFFSEGFDDGAAPPSMPPPVSTAVGGAYAVYSIDGSAGTEAGSVLHIDTDNGLVSANPVGQNRQSVSVALHSDAGSGVALGLKKEHVFAVAGLFTMGSYTPGPLEGFGIYLDDSDQPRTSRNDRVSLQVVGDASGGSLVRLYHDDFPAHTHSLIGEASLPSGLGSVSLVLDKPVSGGSTVYGSYAWYDGSGSLLGAGTLGSTDIFHGEDYTRGNYVAFAVPEPKTWAMLVAGIGLIGWIARRRMA